MAAATSSFSLRWYFCLNYWHPTKQELSKISGLIQQEEKARISRFHFLRDAKAAIVGRLMIRKLINLCTGVPNDGFVLGRDEHNKPFLVNIEPSAGPSTARPDNLNFNISHEGAYVVLASDSAVNHIGIDVMDISKPGRGAASQEEYFRLMNRQFTPGEWNQIKGPSIHSRITNFTRFWCLKESFVKATGVGIVIDLRTIDFQTEEDLIYEDLVNSTHVVLNGVPQLGWTFEERFIDVQHIVAVAKSGVSPCRAFEEVSIDFLLLDMNPLQPEEHRWADDILTKAVRNAN